MSGRRCRNCNSYSIVVSVTPVTEHKPTFCRICEPLCGMIATVEDGKLVALRPDKDHPLSSGFACQKGIAFTEVHNDPDRVTTPLRRSTERLRSGQLGRGADRHRDAAVGRSSADTARVPSVGTWAIPARSATRTRSPR